ncbi:MAG: response regulator [Chloroflexota bacterium]
MSPSRSSGLEARYRVLVVDDDDSVRAGLAQALELAGYLVRVESNGRAALDGLDGHDPHLVILDVVMPEMDGLAFVRELDRRGLRPTLRVLLISANTDGHERATELRTDGFLRKPLRLSALLAEVARILETLSDDGA